MRFRSSDVATRWLAITGLVTLSFVPALFSAQVAQAATPPDWTFSRYMSSNDEGHAYDLGCALANDVDYGAKPSDSMTILAFGAPVQIDSNTWGATLFGGPDSSTTKIRQVAQNFALGFYNCINTTGAFAKISIGTSNDWPASWGSTKETNHGQAWGILINNANDWAAGGYASRVSFSGGSDMEPGFKDPGDTRDWVNGFGDTVNDWNLFNFGSADGCSQTIGNYSACGTGTHPGWGSNDVWYISWGSGWSNPVPEVYYDVNATQWYWLSKYGLDNHPAVGAMNFAASLSQRAACSCTNTPNEAWNALWDAIHPGATADDIRWSSNIKFD